MGVYYLTEDGQQSIAVVDRSVKFYLGAQEKIEEDGGVWLTTTATVTGMGSAFAFLTAALIG